MYEDLTHFEKTLARFGDRVELIVGLELGDKLTSDQAYEQIKELYKELKKVYKAKE
jgi:hypothetical protein